MNKIFILLFLFSSFISISAIKLLSSAFSDIIKNLFIDPQIPFDVIIYKSTSPRTYDLINKVGSELSGKVIKTSEPLQLTQSALILAQNGEDLKELFNRTELKNFYAKPLRFLIHTEKNFKIESLKVPKPNFDQGHIGHFSYFVIDSLKEIQFKTLEWFTEKICNVQQEILINKFVKSSGKWIKKLSKIEEKFKNFHNCTLEVFSRIYNYELIYTMENPNKIQKLQASETKMVQAIAQHGKFTPNFNWQGTGDLQIYYIPRTIVLNDECQVTTLFWEDFLTIVTTPAESYNSYEKLLLTFDRWTWFCLLATFSCAFLVIFIVNQMPKKIQNLFYGENVQSPSMNVIGLFFGLGQTKLPRNDFARIIFATYIMFCIVIGTAYHGVFFELMTTDVTKPLPTSLEDLRKENFSFYSCYANSDQEKNEAEIRKLVPEVIIIPNNLFGAAMLWPRFAFPSEKIAYFETPKSLDAVKTIFKNPPRMMKLRFKTMHLGIATMRNNFIYGVIDDAMSLLVTNGIPQYFLKYIQKEVLREMPVDEKEPKKFSVEDLKFGFVIHLICCAVATFVFICELVIWHGKNLIGLREVLRSLVSEKLL